MQYAYNLSGDSTGRIITFKLGGTCVAGTLMELDDSNKYGEAIPLASVTASTDCLGLALASVTYSTILSTNADEDVVPIVINPFAVYRAKCAGSATSGAALTAATKHLLTQTSASTTVMTSGDAPTADMTMGTLLMVSGANTGASRVVTSVGSGTSATVTVPFASSMAVGDVGLLLPYSRMANKVQPTTDLTQANAAIATGTGIDCAVVDLEFPTPISSTAPEAFVYFVLHDHFYNPVD